MGRNGASSCGLGALALASTLFWALAMFGNEISEAVIHQGCLAVPLLGVAICVAAAYAANTRFAIGLVAFNVIFALVLEVPSLTPPPETTYSAFVGPRRRGRPRLLRRRRLVPALGCGIRRTDRFDRSDHGQVGFQRPDGAPEGTDPLRRRRHPPAPDHAHLGQAAGAGGEQTRALLRDRGAGRRGGHRDRDHHRAGDRRGDPGGGRRRFAVRRPDHLHRPGQTGRAGPRGADRGGVHRRLVVRHVPRRQPAARRHPRRWSRPSRRTIPTR